jgi:hypothetical protein
MCPARYLDGAVTHPVIVHRSSPNPAAAFINADAGQKTLFVHRSTSIVESPSWSKSVEKTSEKEHTFV